MSNPRLLTFAPHGIVAEFYEQTRYPSQAQIDALMRRGITPWSLAGAPGSGEYGIGFARIDRAADGQFEFTDGGVPAIAVIALDAFGDPVDIVAWPLRCEWISSWLGRASMLGERDAFGPRIDPALTVHRSGFDWLLAERQGVVLIHEPRAARELRDHGPLRVSDVGDGLRLQALTPPVSIVVRRPEREKAAA